MTEGRRPAPGGAVADRLRVRGLRVIRSGRPVVQDVDLTVAPGEVVAVLGPNGAGKTTLLHALGGLLEPDGGEVHREGRVATVMQSPGLARRSALANVELAMSWWGVPRHARRSRAEAALARLGVSHLAQRPAAAMSGGEQRRVHLARGLAVEPDILLLDEPFAGLDAASHRALCEDAATVLRAPERAVVLVVHDRNEAFALADRLLLLFDGRVAAAGSPRDVLDRPPSVEAARFLGYDGELRTRDGLLLTRAAHVLVDAAGDVTATVARVIPHEDAARLELVTPHGTVRTHDPTFQVRAGDAVRVRVVGGARFGHGEGPAPMIAP